MNVILTYFATATDNGNGNEYGMLEIRHNRQHGKRVGGEIYFHSLDGDAVALVYVYVLFATGSNSTWLDSTRLDTFDFVEPVEQVETSVSSETSRALPTWRTTNDLVQV